MEAVTRTPSTRRPRPARRTLLAAGGAALLLLAGCTGAGTETDTTAAFLAAHDLAGMDATQIVEHLEALPLDEQPTELLASVRPDELVLADETQEITLPLDAGFHLSIAPYVQQTHDCFHHSLTTCRGELADTEVTVKVTDDATGEVLVDEPMTTYENGFVAMWLPADVKGTVEITTADGLRGTQQISTGEDGATCLTTLQLTEA